MEELEVPETSPENVDLAEAAVEHVRRDGMVVDRTSGETAADEQRDMDLDGNDDDWEETPEDRYRRSSDATQDEISDPEFRAEIHSGESDEFNYDRMVQSSQQASTPECNCLTTKTM